MRDARTIAVLGTIAIALIVIGVVASLEGADLEDEEATTAEPADDELARSDRAASRGGSPESGGSRGAPSPSRDPGSTPDRDLEAAARAAGPALALDLARVFDAGPARGAPIPGAPGLVAVPSPALDVPLAPGSDTPAPPRPYVRLDRPPTAEEQLDYAMRYHQFILMRRDQLRAQLATAESAHDEATATRIRRDLERLEASEETVRHRTEELEDRAGSEGGGATAPAAGP